MEFFYVKQMIGSFNRSASEFGAYIGFSYQNRSWKNNRFGPIDNIMHIFLFLSEFQCRIVAMVEWKPSEFLWNTAECHRSKQLDFSLSTTETMRQIWIAPTKREYCPIWSYATGMYENRTCSMWNKWVNRTEQILFTYALYLLGFVEIDHCFENNICGIHGVCSNDGNTFHCECAFLYDGQYCDQCLWRQIFSNLTRFQVFFFLNMFLDSSEAMQVIGASLFVTVACISIFVCKRIQTYRTNRRRRHMQRRNEHR